MNAIAKIRYSFGRYDRITINGDNYRWVKFEHGNHLFQRVTETSTEQVLEDDCIIRTDLEIHDLVRRKLLKQEAEYFSKALTELRMRQDNTDLSDLEEEDVRTLFWKREWCVRFNRAQAGLDNYPFRPTMAPEDLDFFVELIRDDMARWYFKRYGEHRRPGRPALVKQTDGSYVKERKMQDYPGATALRNWLNRYKKANHSLEAFVDRYDRCGRRDQLHPEVDVLVTKCASNYAAPNRPTREHIHEDIKVGLLKINAKRPGQPKLSVSLTTVNARINRLNPFLVEAGRYGEDVALRKYAPAGQGLQVVDFLDRVEIDDWTVDLFALICTRPEWRRMDRVQRKNVPRVRATVTVAIDCATRCIVGLNISETAPTTAAAKGALQSILMDKSPIAALYAEKNDWPMQGRPRQVVTDGGPVFGEEFERAVGQVRADRTMPNHDPRMRPYVESVNRTLKAFCRYFTGQSFATVVEKGDYQAEAMTSLTFESFQAEFYKFVIDKYHRRAHRGLKGLSPYAMWELVTGGQRELPIGDAQRIATFGFKEIRRALDKHGILNIGISYWSPELHQLFTILGIGGRVDFFVDPTSVGRVLVVVPKARRTELRDAILRNGIEIDPLSSESHIMVPSVDLSVRDMSISQFARMNPELKAAIEATQERDETFRLHAHESLTRVAQQVAKEAGVQDHAMNQKRWDALSRIIKQKSRAAKPPEPDESGSGDVSVDGDGTVFKARSTGNRRGGRKPTSTDAQPVRNVRPAPRTAAPQGLVADDEEEIHIPSINDIPRKGTNE